MDVLVVEDNEVVADSLAFLLDCYGHRATVVEDGESALSLLCCRAFELVLLDENLPGIKGSSVALSIVNTFADRPFIVSMTGDSEDTGFTRLFDVCLQKPFSLEALLQVIEDAQSNGDVSALLAA
ncbi:CheY-like chemotaxis protein [Paraburkholderia sp. Clong3]|uniref:response regulator n=1 Tax=Paraburkholderia sp. Clong3 TaxID=2991061 RepID=UPI003D1D644B